LDMLTKDSDFPGEVVIPSKVITKSYLNVFIPFSENIEERIFLYNDSLRPKTDRRGLTSSIKINTNWGDEITSARQKDSIRRVYLRTFNEIYSFKIDSLPMDEDFILTTGPKKLLGFETNLNISDLEEGKHVLRLRRKRREKDTIVTVTSAVIPFWSFKD